MVTPNEPWKVVSSTHLKSLQVHAGGTTAGPQFCVGTAEDALRLFVKLPVSHRIAARPHRRGERRQPCDQRLRHQRWRQRLGATQRIMLPDIHDASGKQLVTVSFSTRGTAATWTIDDVMLDPWRLV